MAGRVGTGRRPSRLEVRPGCSAAAAHRDPAVRTGQRLGQGAAPRGCAERLPGQAFVAGVRAVAPRADRRATDETKTRYAFIYGDLRRLHRTGLIACVYRASEWRHKDIELAAHDLLQLLDKATGLMPRRVKATPKRSSLTDS